MLISISTDLIVRNLIKVSVITNSIVSDRGIYKYGIHLVAILIVVSAERKQVHYFGVVNLAADCCVIREVSGLSKETVFLSYLLGIGCIVVKLRPTSITFLIHGMTGGRLVTCHGVR